MTTPIRVIQRTPDLGIGIKMKRLPVPAVPVIESAADPTSDAVVTWLLPLLLTQLEEPLGWASYGDSSNLDVNGVPLPIPDSGCFIDMVAANTNYNSLRPEYMSFCGVVQGDNLSGITWSLSWSHPWIDVNSSSGQGADIFPVDNPRYVMSQYGSVAVANGNTVTVVLRPTGGGSEIERITLTAVAYSNGEEISRITLIAIQDIY